MLCSAASNFANLQSKHEFIEKSATYAIARRHYSSSANLQSAALCCSAQQCKFAKCYAVLRCAVSCGLLCCAGLCCGAVLCCAVLCCATVWACSCSSSVQLPDVHAKFASKLHTIVTCRCCSACRLRFLDRKICNVCNCSANLQSTGSKSKHAHAQAKFASKLHTIVSRFANLAGVAAHANCAFLDRKICNVCNCSANCSECKVLQCKFAKYWQAKQANVQENLQRSQVSWERSVRAI